MDSWLFNKIAGAVLAALLVAFGSGTVAGIFSGGHGGGHGGEHDEHAKVGYALPVTAPATGGATVAAAPAFKFAEIVPLLKSASADDGKDVFNQCRSCHSADKGGKPLTGPNLWGVVGRDVASNADFPRYSSAMKANKGAWTLERLGTYLHDPKAAVPGNQMAFNGVPNNTDLAGLLLYLRSLSDSPAPLPN